jgi:branched-chain amino acid transport system ATP-binding protein
MLRLTSVIACYGRIVALRGVSLHVSQGEIVAIIGANGAGKTTLLDAVSGILPARSGSINFAGAEVRGVPTERLVRMGMCQVPQGRQLFPDMTTYENLLLGSYRRSRADKRLRLKDDLARVYSIFPLLKERSHQLAGTLSGGEQQMLAIGRALMSKPKLLLLDEPSMGLAPLVVREIYKVIDDLHKQGTTVLIVEQNAKAALRVAQRGYVLETGRVVLEGTAHELARNPEVQRAYLGKDYRHLIDGEKGGSRHGPLSSHEN